MEKNVCLNSKRRMRLRAVETKIRGVAAAAPVTLCLEGKELGASRKGRRLGRKSTKPILTASARGGEERAPLDVRSFPMGKRKKWIFSKKRGKLKNARALQALLRLKSLTGEKIRQEICRTQKVTRPKETSVAGEGRLSGTLAVKGRASDPAGGEED